MTTIYEAIERDHAHHRDLLDRLAGTSGDSEERRTMWHEFYYDVKSHAAAEEETFYSKLIAQPMGQEPARHSVHEHQQLDDLMEELNDMDMSSSGWLTKFRTLKHDYEHHMDEEENEIFEKAREVLKGDEDASFAKAFETRKKAELELVDQKAEDKIED